MYICNNQINMTYNVYLNNNKNINYQYKWVWVKILLLYIIYFSYKLKKEGGPLRPMLALCVRIKSCPFEG